jgi:hypothetical protein
MLPLKAGRAEISRRIFMEAFKFKFACKTYVVTWYLRFDFIFFEGAKPVVPRSATAMPSYELAIGQQRATQNICGKKRLRTCV